jgi:hypothetical protein
MKTFTQLREETSSYETHKRRVQKIPKGSSVSFTQTQTGKKVSGTYKGLKQMGGRSYAHVEHGDGATYVPVHQIHESVDEAVDHKERVKKIPKGTDVSFTHATTGKKVTGTFKGLKQMGGRSYAHVEHKDGATYVPLHQIHEGAIVESIDEAHEEGPEHKWDKPRSHLHQFYTSLNKKGDGWITQHNKGETTHHKTYQGVTDHIKKFVGPKEPHIHTTNDLDPRAEKIFDRDDEGWKKHPLLKMKESVQFDEASDTSDSKHTHNWYDMSKVPDEKLDRIDDTDQSTFLHSSMIEDKKDSGYNRPDHHLGVHKSNKSANATLKRMGATKVE